jgi:CRP-like cAMP-binding protein
VTEAESALERQLSRELMSGASSKRRKLEPDETLVKQGESGDDLYLLLDGVLAVEVDDDEVAELGPGAILGEFAGVEGGKRTATLTARTRCRVGVVPAELIDRPPLEKLAAGRRER